MFARQVDLGHHRRHAAAELAIERVLRGPEHHHRLAARARRVDLRAHHRAQQAAAAMRRQHADDRQARGLHLPARHGEIEREHARAGDRVVALERRMHALRRQDPLEALHDVVGRRVLPEIVPDRRERRAHLVRVGARPHLHDTPRHSRRMIFSENRFHPDQSGRLFGIMRYGRSPSRVRAPCGRTARAGASARRRARPEPPWNNCRWRTPRRRSRHPDSGTSPRSP